MDCDTDIYDAATAEVQAEIDDYYMCLAGLSDTITVDACDEIYNFDEETGDIFDLLELS